MTERDAPKEPSRRRVLAATGVGLAGALAGCGYRPGGGDLSWKSSLGGGGLFGPGDRWFRQVGDRLFVLRNRSGRTYDFEADEWRELENAGITALDPAGETLLEAETERQAAGPPAVTDESMFVPVEGARVTAIDRDAAETDPNGTGTATGEAETTEAEVDTTEADAIRWQTAAIAPDDDDSGESDGSPGIGGIRASDRLVVTVGATHFVALDAETGDRAFEVTEAWPGLDDVGLGVDPDRVAVGGGDVWVAIEGTESVAGSGSVLSVVARFGPSGERRVDRPIPDGADWLVVVDGTVVIGNAERGSVTGFDRDLDRLFALDVPTPRERPPLVEGGGSDGDAAPRVYLRRGDTVRALDVAAGEIAWERADLPASRPFAADERGIYAVGREAVREGSRETRPVIVAVGADGRDRWSAPLPEGVLVEELFAVGDRLLVVDGEKLYGLRASPGERWSLL